MPRRASVGGGVLAGATVVLARPAQGRSVQALPFLPPRACQASVSKVRVAALEESD